MRGPSCKFQIGDRVVVAGSGGYPPFWAKRGGEVTGRYDLHDSIPRKRDTVLATTPWPELMYTVQFDDQGDDEDPTIVNESWLVPVP